MVHATDGLMQGAKQAAPKPPPKLWSVKEAHFEAYQEPQPDGYREARARGANGAAIVIDNGTCSVADHDPKPWPRAWGTNIDMWCRFVGNESWLVL